MQLVGPGWMRECSTCHKPIRGRKHRKYSNKNYKHLYCIGKKKPNNV